MIIVDNIDIGPDVIQDAKLESPGCLTVVEPSKEVPPVNLTRGSPADVYGGNAKGGYDTIILRKPVYSPVMQQHKRRSHLSSSEV